MPIWVKGLESVCAGVYLLYLLVHGARAVIQQGIGMSMEKINTAERLLVELEGLEGRLEQLREGLMRSHRLEMLGTMSSIIAHEYNNILTPMISYCQLAQSNPDDIELLRKAVGKSLNGALNAAEISNSILGFCREDDGEERCCVGDVVREVFQCLGRDPEKDGIELHLEIGEGLFVMMSPTELQQVLLNLVLNARQAMKARGGKLRIKAIRDGEVVKITVMDTGIGIDKELVGRVFDVFVTQREGDESKGTGLGLAICRELVTKANGKIEVESSEGAGATFRIELPWADG